MQIVRTFHNWKCVCQISLIMEMLFYTHWKCFFTSFLLIVATCFAIVCYHNLAFKYWQKRGVPTLPPRMFYGNMPTLIINLQHIGCIVKDVYSRMKVLGHKQAGFYFFSIPQYVAVDLQIIKSVMQLDFQHFTKRGLYVNEKDDPLSANMVTLGGERWKSLRGKLVPAFAPGKVKKFCNIMNECACQMQQMLDKLHQNQTKLPVDVLDVTTCYTTDVTGSYAFGIQCNSFLKEDTDFIKYLRRGMGMSLTRLVKTILSFICPNALRRLGMRLYDAKSAKFFEEVVTTTLRFRKTNNVSRHDLLQLLIELQEESSENKDVLSSMSMQEVTANVHSFFVAGYETTSVTMAFCLYELSVNPEVQQRAREELKATLAKHNGEITYESIADLTYLEQVLDETLRKYPPFSAVTRECSKEYQVPGTNSVIEKGILIFIPVLGLHHDPEYFPQPEKFDPDRFSYENRQLIKPFTYMPFGAGPRQCPGLRLAMLEMKIGLATLLRQYVFSVNKNTIFPIEMDPLHLITTPRRTIWLNIEKCEL